ncbi:MAG: 3-keto-disaccharide hydrolase [Planctomycetota bacterium]
MPDPTQPRVSEPAPTPTPCTVKPGEALRLFDDKTLAGWRVTDEEDFALHGPVGVEEGALVLGEGKAFTGVTWDGEFPREGYEVSLEARRRQGQDIFCGLTFPVGDSHATLIVGGWSNNVVGVSNVDGLNASENDWLRVMRFEDRRWYAVRLRVTSPKIEAWIDGERVLDLERAGHVFTTYDELKPHRPLGFFTWFTVAELRKVEMRRLP